MYINKHNNISIISQNFSLFLIF